MNNFEALKFALKAAVLWAAAIPLFAGLGLLYLGQSGRTCNADEESRWRDYFAKVEVGMKAKTPIEKMPSQAGLPQCNQMGFQIWQALNHEASAPGLMEDGVGYAFFLWAICMMSAVVIVGVSAMEAFGWLLTQAATFVVKLIWGDKYSAKNPTPDSRANEL